MLQFCRRMRRLTPSQVETRFWGRNYLKLVWGGHDSKGKGSRGKGEGRRVSRLCTLCVDGVDSLLFPLVCWGYGGESARGGGIYFVWCCVVCEDDVGTLLRPVISVVVSTGMRGRVVIYVPGVFQAFTYQVIHFRECCLVKLPVCGSD